MGKSHQKCHVEAADKIPQFALVTVQVGQTKHCLSHLDTPQCHIKGTWAIPSAALT